MTVWTVSGRFASIGSVVRWWDVLRDGVVMDTFANEELARAHADYRNAHGRTN